MIYVIFLAILLIGFGILKWRANLNWTLLYTAHGYEKYFEIVSLLNSGGISYKTNTPTGSIRGGRETQLNDYTQYDIYVKKEEEHKAVQTINGRN